MNWDNSESYTGEPDLPPMELLETEWRRRQELQTRGEQAHDIEASERRCESFIGFVQEAWHALEPNNRYVHNWHADAIAEHLEAVIYGKINPQLLINVPAGTSKSLFISVLWPAWEWGPAGLASLRYLSTSYLDSYVTRGVHQVAGAGAHPEHMGPRAVLDVDTARIGITWAAHDRTAAYWLMLTVRDAVPKTHHLARAEFATLRLQLLKLGARVIETVSRIRLASASACPEAKLFRTIAIFLQPAGP